MIRLARASLLTFAVVTLGVGGLAGPAHAQLPPDAVAEIEQIVAQPNYANSTWGIEVQDLATGEVLYASNADLMYVPGSIMKNFATSAALAAEGPDFRFRTPVFKQGEIDGKDLDGDLVLVGSGDTSFGLRDQPDGTLAFTNFDHNEANNIPGVTLVDGNPLAGVNQLARDVKRSGIDRVSGDVVIDDRLWKTYEGPSADGPSHRSGSTRTSSTSRSRRASPASRRPSSGARTCRRTRSTRRSTPATRAPTPT